MNIELNFRTLKRTENINLIYLKSQNGYYLDKKTNQIYELISSIENGKGEAIQYRYENTEDKNSRYMYRIGIFSNGGIIWTEWESKFSKVQLNEFSYDVDKKNDITSRLDFFKSRRLSLFNEKFILKEKFYPKLPKTLSNDERSIYLSTIKQMEMLKSENSIISITPTNIPNEKMEKLIKQFPEEERAIRTDINGIFVIPKNCTINLPLVRTKEIITGEDNSSINKLSGEVNPSIQTDQSYTMGDQNGILIVETNIGGNGNWFRHYTVITIYEICTKKEVFIYSGRPLSTSGWNIMARAKNMEDIYKFRGAR